jgi:L-threonylcarbamoyladenylate synthase
MLRTRPRPSPLPIRLRPSPRPSLRRAPGPLPTSAAPDLDCTIKCRGVSGPDDLADIVEMDRSSYRRAAKIVREGGLVVYPTDTVYGLGCDPFNEMAVSRLFATKGRTSKPVPVLCSSLERASELVELPPRALKLATEFWPGALTIVAPLRKRIPIQLTQGSSKLGVRVPALEACLELISSCGGWLTGTSANLSGRPSARTALDASNQLGRRVDLILDGGRLEGKESTVVEVEGDKVAILRTGPIGVGGEVKGRRTS